MGSAKIWPRHWLSVNGEDEDDCVNNHNTGIRGYEPKLDKNLKAGLDISSLVNGAWPTMIPMLVQYVDVFTFSFGGGGEVEPLQVFKQAAVFTCPLQCICSNKFTAVDVKNIQLIIPGIHSNTNNFLVIFIQTVPLLRQYLPDVFPFGIISLPRSLFYEHILRTSASHWIPLLTNRPRMFISSRSLSGQVQGYPTT